MTNRDLPAGYDTHEARIIRLEVTMEIIAECLKQIHIKLERLDNRIWQMMIFNVSGFGSVLFILAKIKGWV